MKEIDLHVWAGIGTALVCALLATPVIVFAGNPGLPGLRLDDMESIEAALAMKSDTKKQPDKPVAPAPVKTPDEVIGGDPDAKPTTCKKDADCTGGQICRNGACVADKTAPDSTVVMPPRRYEEDNPDTGAPTLPDLGQFDGSERGFAQKSSGHPYMQELAADVHEFFEYPKLLEGQGSVDVCVHLTPEGKIAETQKWQGGSGNPEIDDSGERAVKKMVERRNANPIQVPTDLLAKGITTKWLCFRLTP